MYKCVSWFLYFQYLTYHLLACIVAYCHNKFLNTFLLVCCFAQKIQNKMQPRQFVCIIYKCQIMYLYEILYGHDLSRIHTYT